MNLRALLALSILAVSAGCAGRRIKREDIAALSRADALVLQGCYDCLLDARASYERLSRSKYVNADSAARRLFETNLLLSLREKELQLDWRDSFARAAAVAPRLRSVLDIERVLAVADAVLPDGTGRMNDWTDPLRRERAAYSRRVADEVRWVSTAPLTPAVREYLALALDCSYDARVLAPRVQPGASERRPVLRADATPIVMYRTGICLTQDPNMLAATLAVVPRFHEAAYFAGIPAAFAAESDGGDRARTLLGQGYARFPRSPAVTYMSGWLAMNLGDCRTGNRFFDETVAIDSTHEFALLQGTVCRSRLHMDSAALRSATRLIALNGGSTQQGYYWRAVSRLRLRDLPAARADIEQAKALERDANALTMAGIIENEQGDLAIAERDLTEARALPRGDMNCTAAWTLGLVIGKTNRPKDAADALESAMRCYDIRVAAGRLEMDRLLRNPPRNHDYLRRRLDGLAADTVDLRTRYHAAAFNAAGHRANAGSIPQAMELLDIAARDVKLAEPVSKLREAIQALRR